MSFQASRKPSPEECHFTIAVPVDGALVEHHDVLGEGARLIREDVLHLAQLFVQSGGTGLCGRPLLHAEHLLVPVDEIAVAQTDDFHTAQRTGGEAWEAGRDGGIPPAQASAAGAGPGEEQEWRRHLGREPGRQGAGKPAGGAPNPTLLMLSTQRCKGSGQAGRTDRRTAQAEKEEDCTQGAGPVLTSELNTETMQRKRRENAEGRKGERREIK